jgi:GATA-binding protein, other eukaryote
MFDSVTLDHQAFYSPSISQNPFRPASPSASSATGNGITHLEPPQTVEARKALQTRVSELEVINGLFSGRVQELELSVDESKRKEEITREVERKVQAELEQALSREAELKRRVEELEAELTELREGPRTKRMRLSDLVEDGSQASTPLSSAS